MSLRRIAHPIVERLGDTGTPGLAFDAGHLASVPVILVSAVAFGLLVVLALDVHKLHRASRLNAVHAVTCGVLALTVVSLATMFAAGVAGVPAPSTGEVAEMPFEADPLSGVQLPTLAD